MQLAKSCLLSWQFSSDFCFGKERQVCINRYKGTGKVQQSKHCVYNIPDKNACPNNYHIILIIFVGTIRCGIILIICFSVRNCLLMLFFILTTFRSLWRSVLPVKQNK